MDPFALISAVVERVQQRRCSAMIATVISKSGSAPQTPGARIALFDDGTILGTIGGGAIERQILSLLKSSSHEVTPFCYERHLTHELGMCCGGAMSFFVEPVNPAPRLVLFGAGHVAEPTAKVALGAGFEVLVIDEREEWNNLNRFENCKSILDDGVDLLRVGNLKLNAHDYVLICTHSHRLDEELLSQCAKQSPKFLGMIGSRRKAELIKKRVLAKNPNANLERIRSPVGLDINATSPEEIAVSVVAELISVRRAGQKLSSRSEAARPLGIILAAGAANRLGFPKALGKVMGTSVLEQIHENLLVGGCEEVCVVVAEPHEAKIRKAHPEFWYVSNPEPSSGMLGSFLCGLRAVRTRAATKLVLATLDQPRIKSSTIRLLLDQSSSLAKCYLVPTYSGRHGHPIVLDIKLNESAAKAQGTLRDFLNTERIRTEVGVDDEFITDDLNTPEDALRLGVTHPVRISPIVIACFTHHDRSAATGWG